MELNLEQIYEAIVKSSAILDPSRFSGKIKINPTSNLIQDLNSLIIVSRNQLEENIRELRFLFFLEFILEQPPSKSQYVSLIKFLKVKAPDLTKDHIVFYKLKSAFYKLHSSAVGAEAIDPIIQNIELLDELKNNFSTVEVVNQKRILYRKFECAFLSKINSTKRPNPQELFIHYHFLERYIKTGYALINSTIKQKIIEYFNDNSSDLKECESLYLTQIPNKFLYKRIIRMYLFELFIKEFYYIVIDLDHRAFDQQTYISTKNEIKIYQSRANIKITIFSYQNILAKVLNEVKTFIKLNTISQGIKFNGVYIDTYDSMSLIFDHFGEPFGSYIKKLNDIPDNKMLYFIKEIAKDAINLIENEFVLDFLHPGNIFVSNNCIFIFPNTYTVDCFANTLYINTRIFKEDPLNNEQNLVPGKNEKKNLNQELVYSIGMMALYMKHPDINSSNIESYKANIPTDFGENAELIQAFFSPKSTRITLEEILECIQ